MKKVLSLFLTFLMFASLFSCADVNVITSEDNEEVTYKLVEPTQEEFKQIPQKLGEIFSNISYDYNYLEDNIYFTLLWEEYAFAELIKDDKGRHIARPLRTENGVSCWSETVYEDDPLGYFEKVPEVTYDESGNKITHYPSGENLRDVVVGYRKFSGNYIDWIVGEVWNGTVDHDAKYESEYGLSSYYHDGFYYVTELSEEGPGPIYEEGSLIVESIIPFGNFKYKIKVGEVNTKTGEVRRRSVLTLAMKQASNGFRFWSIYDIEKYHNSLKDKKEQEQAIREQEPKEYYRPKWHDELDIENEYINTAVYIVQEAVEMQSLMYNYGLSEGKAREWESLTENRIPLPQDMGKYEPEDLSESTGYLVYYSERFDTMEKFDSFFSQMFTEETLEIRKQAYHIEEVDGRLAVQYIEDKNPENLNYEFVGCQKVIREGYEARVFLDFYDVDGNYLLTKEYTLKYSDEHGWRFHTESPLFS